MRDLGKWLPELSFNSFYSESRFNGFKFNFIQKQKMQRNRDNIKDEVNLFQHFYIFRFTSQRQTVIPVSKLLVKSAYARPAIVGKDMFFCVILS